MKEAFVESFLEGNYNQKTQEENKNGTERWYHYQRRTESYFIIG